MVLRPRNRANRRHLRNRRLTSHCSGQGKHETVDERYGAAAIEPYAHRSMHDFGKKIEYVLESGIMPWHAGLH